MRLPKGLILAAVVVGFLTLRPHLDGPAPRGPVTPRPGAAPGWGPSEVRPVLPASPAPDAAAGRPLAIPSPGGSWAQVAARLEALPPEDRRALAAAWAQHLRRMGTPVWEAGRAYLFYAGAARQVEVAGDFTDWHATPMHPVAGTDLWVTGTDLPDTAVVSYRLLVDGRSQADPLNPRRTRGLGLDFSVIMGPRAPGEEPPAGRPARTATLRLEVRSRYLGRTVTAAVHVPAACSRQSPCSVLYAADGPDYTGEGRLPAILAAEAAAGRVPALVLVAIDPPPDPFRRTAELLPGVLGDAWPRFLAEELVPAAETRLPVRAGRANRALLGLSAGAAGMLNAALVRPEDFGRVIAQSPASLPPVLAGAVARFDGTPPRVWLTWGTYERNIFGLDIAGDARRLFRDLRARGFPVAGGERPAGHTMAVWRRDLPAALRWAWSAEGARR